ncbi:hypothetical protein JVU11DRAFT_3257 [Chiua virens]|nr:hypothetical protein JVU11DRAFT_3257 [Chiua virens]
MDRLNLNLLDDLRGFQVVPAQELEGCTFDHPDVPDEFSGELPLPLLSYAQGALRADQRVDSNFKFQRYFDFASADVVVFCQHVADKKVGYNWRLAEGVEFVHVIPKNPTA